MDLNKELSSILIILLIERSDLKVIFFSLSLHILISSFINSFFIVSMVLFLMFSSKKRFDLISLFISKFPIQLLISFSVKNFGGDSFLVLGISVFSFLISNKGLGF